MTTPPKFNVSAINSAKVRQTALSLWLYACMQMGIASVITSGLGLAAGLLETLLALSAGQHHQSTLLWGLVTGMESMQSAATLISTLICGPLAGWFLMQRAGYSVKSLLHQKTDISFKDTGKGLCILLTLSTAASAILGLLSMLIFRNTQTFSMELPGMDGFFSQLLMFASVVIAAPVMEEFFFRGCILKLFENDSPWFGMVFSAFCFGLMHLNIAQGIPAFFMGLVLAWYTMKSKTIVPAILIHAANNLLAYASIFLVAPSIIISVLALAGLIIMGLHYKRIVEIVKAICHTNIKPMFSGWAMKLFLVFFVLMSALTIWGQLL